MRVYHRRILILLRHGRTPNNAQARLQGQFDSPLDKVGFEQSAVVGRALRERWAVDRVVVSSRRRTQQTARVAGLADVPTTVDDRWMELDFGAYDGRRIGEVMAELGGGVGLRYLLRASRRRVDGRPARAGRRGGC